MLMIVMQPSLCVAILFQVAGFLRWFIWLVWYGAKFPMDQPRVKLTEIGSSFADTNKTINKTGALMFTPSSITGFEFLLTFFAFVPKENTKAQKRKPPTVREVLEIFLRQHSFIFALLKPYEAVLVTGFDGFQLWLMIIIISGPQILDRPTHSYVHSLPLQVHNVNDSVDGDVDDMPIRGNFNHAQ